MGSSRSRSKVADSRPGIVTFRGELLDRTRADVDPDVGPQSHFAELARIVGEQRDRAHDQHNVRVRAIGVACAGPIERNCETVSPASVPSWRRFELRQHLRELTGLPGVRRSRRQGDDAGRGLARRGARRPELLHDRGVDARRRRARPRRRPRRRSHRQRRQRRPHHRRTRRTALHVRSPWLSRVRGFRRGDRHDHGPSRHRADVRHHAPHRTTRRTRGRHDLHRARSRSRRRRRRRGARVRGDVLQRRPGGDRRHLARRARGGGTRSRPPASETTAR